VPLHGLERLADRAFDCPFVQAASERGDLEEGRRSQRYSAVELEDPAARLKLRLKRRVWLMWRKATNKTVGAGRAVVKKMRHEVVKSRWQKVQIQGKHIATTTKLVLPSSHDPTYVSLCHQNYRTIWPNKLTV
jgi:hypothetical protein